MTTPAEKASDDPITMWSVVCPFRKTGGPVVGNMGSLLRSVILFEHAEWKRLCEQVPALATTQFRVGTYE